MRLSTTVLSLTAVLAVAECIELPQVKRADDTGGDYSFDWSAESTPAVGGGGGGAAAAGGATATAAAAPKATGAAAADNSAIGGDYSYPGNAAAGTAVGAASAAVNSAIGGDYSYPGTAAAPLATSVATSTASSSSSSSSSGGFLGTIESLVGSLLGNIDFESIAGYLDDILTSGNNIQYLDDILVWLKDSNLLPEAVDFLLKSNFSSPIVNEIVGEALSLVSTLNTTPVFVALDQSGLLYSILADAIEDPATLPAIGNIVSNVADNGGITISEILAAVGRLVKREDGEEEPLTLRQLAAIQYEEAQIAEAERFAKRANFADVIPTDSELYEFAFEKRDNIEDLLTTIFSSVERSGLINETVHTLLVDPSFQTAAADLISGALKSFASGSGNPTNLSFLGPILSGLVDSGILQHTFEKALNDPQLRTAIINDIGGLLSSGTASLTDLFTGKQIDTYYKSLVKAASNNTAPASSTLSTVSASASASGSSAPSSSSTKNVAGKVSNANVLALLAGLSGYALVV